MSERPRDVAREIWNWIWTFEALVVALQVLAALFVGFYVVGAWIIRLWIAQSWWHLIVLAGTSVFLLAGFVMELRARRIGPFGIVVVALALIFGARHLLDKAV